MRVRTGMGAPERGRDGIGRVAGAGVMGRERLLRERKEGTA